MSDRSILIVGAGPVGMTLAALLARHGINVRIVDKRGTCSSGSKALGVNAASLKVFHDLGIVQRVIEQGEQIGDFRVYWHGRPIARIDCARVAGTPYPFSIALPQPKTEQILSSHLQESMGIQIDRSVRLISISHTSDGVDAVLENASGEIEQSRFAFVVGCDGSHSTVRKSLGIGFHGRDYASFMMLIDADIDWTEKAPVSASYFVRNGGFIVVIPLPGGLYRLVMSENANSLEDMKKVRALDEYQRIVDRSVPFKMRLRDIVWESQAPLYNRIADSFGEGRVLLAGDAAHLFSPIGGLGMNTGIQDAASLAWRLAGVFKGRYALTTLDDYRRERRAMAARLVEATDGMTSLITCQGPNLSERAQAWMPKMKNRASMRRIFPLTITGLGQRYDMEMAAAHSLVGGHIPFAVARDEHGVETDTYRLTSDWRPILLAFPVASSKMPELLHAAHVMGIHVVSVIADRSHAQAAQHAQSLIVDPEHAYRRAFLACDNDVLVLRPDGYIADVGRIGEPSDCIARALRVYATPGAEVKHSISGELMFSTAEM